MHHVEIRKYSSLIIGHLKGEKPSITVIICVQTRSPYFTYPLPLEVISRMRKKLAVLALSPDSHFFWNKQSVLRSHFIVSLGSGERINEHVHTLCSHLLPVQVLEYISPVLKKIRQVPACTF